MSDSSPQPGAAAATADESLVGYTHVMYALHSLAILIGITTFHTIVGSFIGSLPSIGAVSMNYPRRSATRRTLPASPLRSQQRTRLVAGRWALPAPPPPVSRRG